MRTCSVWEKARVWNWISSLDNEGEVLIFSVKDQAGANWLHRPQPTMYESRACEWHQQLQMFNTPYSSPYSLLLPLFWGNYYCCTSKRCLVCGWKGNQEAHVGATDVYCWCSKKKKKGDVARNELVLCLSSLQWIPKKIETLSNTCFARMLQFAFMFCLIFTEECGLATWELSQDHGC